DEGGKTVYVPAIYLLQLGNQEDSKVLSMSGEAFVTGLTLGFGGEAVAGGELATEEGAKLTGRALWAARAAKAAQWGDRIAGAGAAASTLINDHRGWILEKFGEDGQKFL